MKFRFIVCLFLSIFALAGAKAQCPTATMLDDDIMVCQGDSTSLLVQFTGTAPWVLDYTINGVQQPPITSNGPVLDLFFFSQPATICLTGVSDAICQNGTATGCANIIIGPPMFCTVAVTNVSCFGANDGSATLTCTGGTPPYTYQWGGNQNGSWTNLGPGTYTVFVMDAAGCSSWNTFTITQPSTPIQCTASVSSSINCNNPQASLLLTCTGGGSQFTYAWEGPNSFNSTVANPIITEPGTYTVTVTTATGCTLVETVIVDGSTVECGSITGTLTTEDDGNCTLDPGESPLANWMVRATGTTGDEYFGFTDDQGHYEFQAAPDDYVVEAIPPANFWQDCTGPVNLTLEDANDVETADFHLFQVINCPLLEVDISTPLLRRCFNTNYFVNYCNIGSETAEDAYLEVTLDPLISIVNANLPYTGPVNGVYTFAVGDLEPGDCGDFQFTAFVSCDAVLGQTLCAEVHAYPDTLCGSFDPNWSGAFLEMTSNCTADSVYFTISNTGTGDMDEPSYFIVVEDGVMLMTLDVELIAGGEYTTQGFPANGSTYAAHIEQVAGVPGHSTPSLFVEGCGTNSAGSFSVGFASQLPENDGDYFVSIDCQPVIGSYDPNDKRGYPLGYSDQHIIEVGQMLDYHIRFQNTGTDTAFLVKIQDVIDPSLDLATLRPGTSSHPYQLEIHQDTLLFIFENILLPDSNVNEPGSHGFVKFRIGQREGLPLGTVIENEADIFFDFNDPVLTNTTLHRLGEHFVLDAGEPRHFPKKIQCLVYPNPMGEEAVIVLQGIENQAVDLHLYDLTGRYLRSEKITGGMGKIRKNGLPAGLYFYEIRANGVAIGQGKLAME